MPEKNTNRRKKQRPLYELVSLAMLTALYVVINRFLSVSAWNINIGFAFAATVTAAAMFGIHGGMIVGGLGDFVGAMLFPKGAYFPGFTLSAALVGLIYGLCLKKSNSIGYVFIGALASQVISSLILNSLWVTVISGAEFKAVLISRLPQFFAITAIQLIISPIIVKVSQTVKKEIGIKAAS
ncbi:MAG: folate family ECF transporter S component [Acutalibacteraceae bacterium]|nr:folate family ECF transporter S component [Oscillospiraceae bacterium]